MIRVLVTGGAGFIGRHVVGRLLDRGDDVVVVDNLLEQAWGGRRPEPDPRARFVEGDVRDPVILDAVLPEVDAVVHQAAMVGLGADIADLPLYAGHNDLGTAVVLAAAARAGIGRVVLASSMVVYGEGRWTCPVDGDVRPAPRRVADLDVGVFEPRCPTCDRPLDWGLVEEDAPVDPRSVYAATKVAQEHLSASWARATGGSIVALRYHNVYGPWMPRDTPYSGVAAIFRSSLERGEAPRVFEDGGQMRDFVHVDDVARANLAALDAQPEGFVAVNVCSGEPHSVGDMAAALAAAYGGPEPIVTGDYRLGDVRHVVASPQRAAEVVGFRAERSFADGMAAFASAPLR
jgi:dTDP-L-rhamnose 4-epimerase